MERLINNIPSAGMDEKSSRSPAPFPFRQGSMYNIEELRSLVNALFLSRAGGPFTNFLAGWNKPPRMRMQTCQEPGL